MTRAQLTRLTKSKTVTHCYIVKGNCYYRANASGYTDEVSKAGVYTKEEAISHAEHCKELYLVPIDIREHNRIIVKEINELIQKII